MNTGVIPNKFVPRKVKKSKKKRVGQRCNNGIVYDPKKHPGEVFNGISLTIPDHTLPLKELVERYMKTGEVQKLTPDWQEHGDLPDFAMMDIQERIEYARELGISIAKAKEKLVKAAAEKADKEAQAKLDKIPDRTWTASLRRCI